MASYNTWDPTLNPAMWSAWQTWDPTMTPTQNLNMENGGYTPAPSFNLDPSWLASLGFTGAPTVNNGNNTDSQAQGDVTSPELMDWLKSKGYTLQLNSSDASHGSKEIGRLVDAQGNQVGQGQQWGQGNDDAFGIGTLLAGGFAGAAAMGAGAAGAGAGTAASTGGSGIGADSLAYGSLENGAAYGSGAGNSLVASSAAGIPEGSLADAAATGGAANMGDAYAAGAGGAGTGGGGLLGSGSGILGSDITAGQLAGYAKTFAPLVGGLLGGAANGSGLNSATTTAQNKIDPRLAQYLYGANGNSGLMGNVGALYNAQMATGGLNPLQQQGIAAQQAVLQNPNYAQGFDAMKSTGTGLLGAPQAGNPFTSGQMQLGARSPASLMQAGRSYLPNPGTAQPNMGIQPVGLLGRT